MPAAVYRAPLRSRRDGYDHAATLARALAIGVCGFGGILRPSPDDLSTAVMLAAAQYGSASSRLIARFAAVADGSFVWTLDDDGLYWLGRIGGPWRYDGSAAAEAVDLVHIRGCRWIGRPLVEQVVPTAVVATFTRGGRNFQQTHDASVSNHSERIWAQLSGA